MHIIIYFNRVSCCKFTWQIWCIVQRIYYSLIFNSYINFRLSIICCLFSGDIYLFIYLFIYFDIFWRIPIFSASFGTFKKLITCWYSIIILSNKLLVFDIPSLHYINLRKPITFCLLFLVIYIFLLIFPYALFQFHLFLNYFVENLLRLLYFSLQFYRRIKSSVASVVLWIAF